MTAPTWDENVQPIRWPAAVGLAALLALVFALVYAIVHVARTNETLVATGASDRAASAHERSRLLDHQEWLEDTIDMLLDLVDQAGVTVPSTLRHAATSSSSGRRETTRENKTRTETRITERAPATTAPRPTTAPPSSSSEPLPEKLPDLPGVNVPSIPVPALPIP